MKTAELIRKIKKHKGIVCAELFGKSNSIMVKVPKNDLVLQLRDVPDYEFDCMVEQDVLCIYTAGT